MRLTQEQIKQIYDDAREQLHQADPLPILQALNVNFVQVNTTSYKLNLRDEKHASAFISFLHGKWVYKDFGDDSSGSIENIVMLVSRRCYKDALSYCMATLSCDTITHKSSMFNNKSQTQEINKSKITQVGEPFAPSILSYLESRKIIKIPSEFKAIEGVYYNKNNEPRKVFGVGILNVAGGADIHFLKQLGNLKTMNLDVKDISLFIKENSSKLAIFESKMDYASAYQNINFNDTNILIANSVSNLQKVVNAIRQFSASCDITIFQQNDQQGRKFAHEIVKQTKIKSFNYIYYNDDETGLDINDLLLKNVNIQGRVKDFKSKKQIHHNYCRS